MAGDVSEIEMIDETRNSQSVGGISPSAVKGKPMCVERHWSRPLLLLQLVGFQFRPSYLGRRRCTPVSPPILGSVNPTDLIFIPLEI